MEAHLRCLIFICLIYFPGVKIVIKREMLLVMIVQFIFCADKGRK